MNKRLSFLLGFIFIFWSSKAQYSYDIDCHIQHQVIDNFGASDAWSFQYLGQSYPESVRNRIADLLFSQEFDKSGSPKGIALSLWRFNIGGGSHDNPNNVITNTWRMTDCLMDSTGRFDFQNKQKGQIWFLKAAKKRGCEQFLGFCNSPPWFMTANKQACNYNRDTKSLNLPSENFPLFADFLAKVWIGLKKEHGIQLDYIAPINEPEWGWNGTGQEGTPCSMEQMSKLIHNISSIFKKRKIKTTILTSESGEYTYMYRNDTGNKEVDDQIAKLYGIDSPYYIGNLYGVKALMAGHSYWTGHREKLIKTREELWNKASEHGIKLWQSELCIMSNDQEIGGGGGRDMSMLTALYVARIMHYDLTVANVSAWQWWTAVSPEMYRDGLIFIDKEEKTGSNNVYIPKLLWAVGNYSRFIRPGAKRVDVKGNINPNNLMVSSYLNENNTLVTVAINYSDKTQTVNINMPKAKQTKYYITSDKKEDNLRYYGITKINQPQVVPAKSIVTFVSKLE
ncbi:glycoside hydrolase family 30 protein [Bacteroides sp.]